MDQQAGQVIFPGGGPQGPPLPEQPQPPAGVPQPERPAELPDPTAPVPSLPPEPQTPQQEPSAVFPASRPGQSQAVIPQAAAPFNTVQNDDWQSQYGVPGQPGAVPDDVSWTAAEFIEHQKSVGWYGLLVLMAIIISGLDFLLTHDFISTGVVLFGVALLGAYANHKPRVQEYRLSLDGLHIGAKVYGFQDFKDFSVADEGTLASINFTPLRRFQLPLTIYVEPSIEGPVLDYLVNFLPFERRQADSVDSMLRRIKF